jgi:general secretion pathway protein E
MGVENFLISSTLLGVLAQRLVRKLCDECKQSATLTQDQKDLLGNIPKDVHFYEAKGCKKCDFTGYHGRKAIGELFVISDTTKEIIEKKGSSDYELRSLAKKEGMKTIADSLKDMLYSGETSYEEAVRLGALDE